MMCMIAEYFILLSSLLDECFVWEQRQGFLPCKMSSGSGRWMICAPVCERRIFCVPLSGCPQEFGHHLALLVLELPHLPSAAPSVSRHTLLHFLPDSSRFPKVSGPSHPNLPKLRGKKGIFCTLVISKMPSGSDCPRPLGRGVKANPARLKRLKKIIMTNLI